MDDIKSLPCMPTECKLNRNNATRIKSVTDLKSYQIMDPSATSAKTYVLNSWVVDTTATLVDLFVRFQKPDIVMLTTGFHGRMDGLTAFSRNEAKAFSQYVNAWKHESIATKLIFRSTILLLQDIMHSNHDYDFQATDLAKQGVWEYWNVTGEVLEKLYWAYHRLEVPYVYFAGDEKNVTSRGFMIDNFHYSPWVYTEINKAFIIKYLLPLEKK